jgi:hypothetical protein
LNRLICKIKITIVDGMKWISFIISLFILFGLTLQAQTIEEANRLFAARRYVEAADMYYQLYQFDRAVESYQAQIDLSIRNRRPQVADSIRPLQAHAERAARMLSRCEDIQIIDSMIVNKNDFFKAYFIGEATGAFEQTGNTVIYENQLKDRRYFGKQADDGNFRLYTQTKMQNRWTEEKQLNLPSDSVANDNFPFVMPDGFTIYYASTGNGSIGGYDLFVSRYNLNNDTYLAPNQMGMPFNSIYNDYMLVIDEVYGIGYFASDRFQPEDSVIIYTFIPNNQIKPIDSDDRQLLIDRAKITSIRDTWLPNADYLSRLERIKSDIEKERNRVQRDFTFPINDNIVYYTLSDFVSDASRNLFLQAKDMEENIKTIESQLDAQRKAFADGNATQRQSLRSPILASEQRLESMLQAHQKLIVETRNSEIRFLRANN